MLLLVGQLVLFYMFLFSIFLFCKDEDVFDFGCVNRYTKRKRFFIYLAKAQAHSKSLMKHAPYHFGFLNYQNNVPFGVEIYFKLAIRRRMLSPDRPRYKLYFLKQHLGWNHPYCQNNVYQYLPEFGTTGSSLFGSWNTPNWLD